MPDYAGGLLQLIDERVAVRLRSGTKMGTVQSRDSTGVRAMVAVDGSSGVPQPVKCFEHVLVDVGDRVGLVRFESDWVIVGNYSLRSLGAGHETFEWSSLSTTTSATYVDMPSSPQLSVPKYRDSTQFRVRCMISAYVTTSGFTVMKTGFRIQGGDGAVDYDMDVARFDLVSTNSHYGWGGIATTTGSLPAGNYTMTARWLRVGGSGTLTVDAQDLIHMEAEEVIA